LIQEPEVLMTVDAEIDALFDAWQSAVSAKDVERIASLTTEDCEFWTNSVPSLVGQSSLRSLLLSFYATYDHRQHFERLELITAEGLAFVRGIEYNYIRPVAGGPEILRLQRAFIVLRRGSDGQWRFARGMTNLPPQDSPTAATDASA
jgi:ketosteroid isomerase-like protein